MKSSVRIITALSLCLISGLAIFAFSQSATVIENDSNLKLADNIPESFGFFTKKDITFAYSNLTNNCNSNTSDHTTTESCYLFDHLVDVGLLKLKGETATVTEDTTATKYKSLLQKSKDVSNTQEILTPAQLKLEYDTLWDWKGAYNKQKALNGGNYQGSQGLFAKYNALCDLARGIYYNPQVTNVKLGETSIDTNTKYLQCIKDIQTLLAEQQTTIASTSEVVKKDTQTKLLQAVNTNTKESNDNILETMQQGKNDSVEILKKAGSAGPMRMCNPGDA